MIKGSKNQGKWSKAIARLSREMALDWIRIVNRLKLVFLISGTLEKQSKSAYLWWSWGNLLNCWKQTEKKEKSWRWFKDLQQKLWYWNFYYKRWDKLEGEQVWKKDFSFWYCILYINSTARWKSWFDQWRLEYEV